MCEATVRLSTTVDSYVDLIINVHAQARGGMRALHSAGIALAHARLELLGSTGIALAHAMRLKFLATVGRVLAPGARLRP